uniref:Neurotransmitter-gated ion-channel transmembrane domain-containing protein n=1 Tax=Plectus sambesii TaxID=2011161 RepID=A0A914WAF7_9BILA
MHLGSWMHTGDQMDIFYSTPTDMDLYNKNTEWDLISFTARRQKSHLDTSATTWVDINYDLVIQRKPTYYLMTFVLPCVIITSISIIGIFAPFSDVGDREEKVTMGLTTLLTMAVILTIVTDKMPKSSEGMPLLGRVGATCPWAII